MMRIDEDSRMSGSGVYAIINTETGDVYIGQATVLKARLVQHLALLRAGKHKTTRLQAAWNEYGEEVFAFAIIEECDPRWLSDKESYYIFMARVQGIAYNGVPNKLTGENHAQAV